MRHHNRGPNKNCSLGISKDCLLAIGGQPVTMIDTPSKSRAGIEAELCLIAGQAKRLPRVVSNGLYPSQWDEHHAQIDELLDEWREAAKTAL